MASAPFDRGAGVHHHRDARGRSPVESILVDNAQLKPDAFGANRYRFVGELSCRFAAPEHIDDVDLERDVRERGVPLFAEHGGSVRMDGDNPFGPALQERCDLMRRAMRVA